MCIKKRLKLSKKNEKSEKREEKDEGGEEDGTRMIVVINSPGVPRSNCKETLKPTPAAYPFASGTPCLPRQKRSWPGQIHTMLRKTLRGSLSRETFKHHISYEA